MTAPAAVPSQREVERRSLDLGRPEAGGAGPERFLHRRAVRAHRPADGRALIRSQRLDRLLGPGNQALLAEEPPAQLVELVGGGRGGDRRAGGVEVELGGGVGRGIRGHGTPGV